MSDLNQDCIVARTGRGFFFGFASITIALAIQGSNSIWAEDAKVTAAKVQDSGVEGSLVIIGGSARNENHHIWSEITRLASRRSAAKRIAVFPCASRYPVKNGGRALSILKEAGAEPFLVPVAPSGFDTDYKELVRDEELVASVRNADGVFFIGGAQGRIYETLITEEGKNTPMLDAVWDLYKRGGVVAGTSAGAAIMSKVMFRDAAVVLSTMLNGVSMGKEIDHGLGFVDQKWFIDQHCLVRGRFARSLVAMHSQKVPFGVGVDEDSALVVERGREARIVGERGAIFMDLSQAKSDRAVPTFNLKNVKLSYLNHGDRLDLATREVTPAPEKANDHKIDPSSPTFRPISTGRRLFFSDILANSTLVDVMKRIIDHKDGQAIGLAFDGVAALKGPTPGFEFRFYRDHDSCGWETDAKGGYDCTVHNIHLDIRPIEIRGPLYSDDKDNQSVADLATGK